MKSARGVDGSFLEPAPEGAGLRAADLGDDERAARRYVLSVVMPLWIASGAIDYVLHRRAHIERNAGSYEAKLHVLGISLTALPVLAGLVCEINAGVIAFMGVGYVTHVGMTVWDVAYADEKRTIVPLEQHIHGMLELLPFCALSFVLCGYREQALALLGRGTARPDFSIKRKRVPLPGRAVLGTIAAFGAFVALPFVEELVRCVRYERDARSSSASSSHSSEIRLSAPLPPGSSP